MQVHLRQRKQSKNGKISLYLEIYKGSILTEEGKVKALRDYEYLDLYLTDNPKTPQEKQANKEKLELAETIRDKKRMELKHGMYKIPIKAKLKADFVKYMTNLMEERKKSKGNYDNWDSSLKHLKAYKGEHIPFYTIDKEFCQGFSNYLQKEAKTSSRQNLSSSSINSYFNKFRAAIKQALKEHIINENPCEDVKLPKVIETPREYLSIDELKRLVKAECRYDVLKRAFLFSCLTGLRWSDVQKLTWQEVQDTDEGTRIVFHQEKTRELEYLDISNQARAYLGERGAKEERVFIGLKYSSYTNVALARWVMAAGINKEITFHCARHTFAVMQLELDTDIYTVQKLLGHRELRTTQVYAKVLDKKKKEAVNKVPDLNS